MDVDDYRRLVDDLEAEEDALDAAVAGLDDAGWARATPAEGWDVRATIAHLAATDDWAVVALSDPDAFHADLAELADAPDVLAREIRAGTIGRHAPAGAGTLDWWRGRRSSAISLLRDRAPSDRLPWFGPDMSAASFATARMMETWAHGRDVYESVGVPMPRTGRMRHVAELGVRTRGWSYTVRGLEPPTTPVRVELAAPDGSAWVWGGGAPDSVRGDAVDFCLVVTQRVNVADTDLVVTGDAATEWMSIAQAFAGGATDPARAYSPVNLGFRFSANAATPSRPSADRPAAPIAWASASS